MAALAKSDEIDPSNGGIETRVLKGQPRLFINRPFWLGVSLVLSVIWVAGTILASLANPDRFVWADQYGLGPTGWWAIVGAVVIVAVCLAIPWIATSLEAEREK